MSIALLTNGLGARSNRAALLTDGLGFFQSQQNLVKVASTALVVATLVANLEAGTILLEVDAATIAANLEAAAVALRVDAATIQCEVTVVVKLKQRENLRVVEFTLFETAIPTATTPKPTPQLANLTNASSATVWYAPLKGAGQQQRAATFLTPRTDGKISYAFTQSDLAVPGEYKVMISVLYSNGEKRYYPSEGHYRLRIEESLGT